MKNIKNKKFVFVLIIALSIAIVLGVMHFSSIPILEGQITNNPDITVTKTGPSSVKWNETFSYHYEISYKNVPKGGFILRTVEFQPWALGYVINRGGKDEIARERYIESGVWKYDIARHYIDYRRSEFIYDSPEKVNFPNGTERPAFTVTCRTTQVTKFMCLIYDYRINAGSQNGSISFDVPYIVDKRMFDCDQKIVQSSKVVIGAYGSKAWSQINIATRNIIQSTQEDFIETSIDCSDMSTDMALNVQKTAFDETTNTFNVKVTQKNLGPIIGFSFPITISSPSPVIITGTDDRGQKLSCRDDSKDGMILKKGLHQVCGTPHSLNEMPIDGDYSMNLSISMPQSSKMCEAPPILNFAIQSYNNYFSMADCPLKYGKPDLGCIEALKNRRWELNTDNNKSEISLDCRNPNGRIP